MSASLLSFLLLALPALAWGGMFHVAGHVLPQVDPYWLTLLRIVPTALCMLLLLAWREPWRTRPAAPQRGRALLLSGLIGFGIFNFALYSGLMMTTPEHGAVIMSMTPLLGAGISWFIDGRVPLRSTLLCIALALLGAVLVITGHPAGASAGSHALLGDGLALLGASAWAFYLRTGGWFAGWSSLRFTALSTAIGAAWIALGVLLLTAVGVLQVPAWSTLTTLAGEMLYMIFIGTLAALLLWNRGIALVGPVNGALFMNLVPVSAFVIGIALGHRPSGSELLGATLVLVALLANNLVQRGWALPSWRSA